MHEGRHGQHENIQRSNDSKPKILNK